MLVHEIGCWSMEGKRLIMRWEAVRRGGEEGYLWPHLLGIYFRTSWARCVCWCLGMF